MSFFNKGPHGRKLDLSSMFSGKFPQNRKIKGDAGPIRTDTELYNTTVGNTPTHLPSTGDRYMPAPPTHVDQAVRPDYEPKEGTLRYIAQPNKKTKSLRI